MDDQRKRNQAKFRGELAALLGSMFPHSGYGAARFDAVNTTMYVENDLKQIMTQTYDVLYRDLDAHEHIPPSPMAVNPGAMEWAYDSVEKRGAVAWMGAGATDAPRSDASKDRISFPVRSFWGSYSYNWEEMMALRFNNIPLDVLRAEAMKRGAAEHEHLTLLNGYTPLKIPGFLTNPATPQMAVPTGNWLSSATTPDQMVADLQAIAHNRQLNTNKVEISDTILLPHEHYLRCVEKVRGSVNDTTVMEMFRKTAPYIKEVKPLIELATAGAGGTPIAIAYTKSSSKLGSVIPYPFQQIDPQIRGLEVIIYAIERIGGTVWTYPASGLIATGI